MNILKSNIKLLILTGISITFLLSCENDSTDIGAGLIPDQSKGMKTTVDLVAYTVSNNDTIRADYSTLTNGLIGVYEDNVFGKSKASFNTQIRLAANHEIKGNIQEVDSVVLTINPSFGASLGTVSSVLKPGNGTDTLKYTTKYPLTSYLGSTETPMPINVNRINTFLETTSSALYSNKVVSVGDLLGTANLGGTLTSISIKTSGGAVITTESKPGYRIRLDPTYFKENFFNKKGAPELSNDDLFVQYFKGIRISPADDRSHFMFDFSRSTMTLVAYYKYKNTNADNFVNATYEFTIGQEFNSELGEYTFDNSTASSQLKEQLLNPNITQGESKLFLQGMGGPSAIIKLDETQISAIRDSVLHKNWAIVNAQLKFNVAETTGTKPIYIYGYNSTKNSFLPDITSFSSLAGYNFNPPYNTETNPDYYILNITQYVKSIVEKNASNDLIKVGIGDFEKNSSDQYVSYAKTTRAYQPYRLVFYGNNETEDKKLKLEITYTKK